MDPLYQVILTAITSFTVCFFAIPSIIKVAEIKNLYDVPCDRKKHDRSIPTLGGIAIFASFIFSVTFWSNQNQIVELQYIIASLIILFFMGIKDDLINLVAHKKLLGQIIAAAILVFLGDIRLTSLFGLLGFYQLSSIASISLSFLAIIGITNAFNLVDGIDTLAASLGILASLIFGSWFFLTNHYQYAILSFAMLGALIAFLRYNSTPAQIFMGDTGSLVLGLVMSVLTIKFIEFNRSYIGPKEYQIFSVPSIAIAILIIPIFDTIRVITSRLILKKSPFVADRNHIHHILVDVGTSHHKATCTLIAINLFLILFNYTNQHRSGETLLVISLIIMLSFSQLACSYRNKVCKKLANHR